MSREGRRHAALLLRGEIVKAMSPDEAFECSRRIRDVLNQFDGTKGCDAVVLVFSGDVDGLKLGHIAVNNPPELVDTIKYLTEYMAIYAWKLGREDGREEMRVRMEALLPKV
jgi:hypothetical protein